MSSLHEDAGWRQAAREVANELDHNNVQNASDLMRQDLFQLHNDPRAQHEFLAMVDRHDQKGYGADLNITMGMNGREQWNITPANYGRVENYPPQGGYRRPDVVVVEPERPSTGERFVDGLATGAGVGIGLGVINRVLGGGNHHRRGW